MLSGVPHGLVLGLILFIIYMNDIDDNLTSRVMKFADNTKLYRSITSNHDILNLSNDINQLCCWSKEWQMLFSVEKCKVMHIGSNNPNALYRMGNITLSEVNEKDLGSFLQKTLRQLVIVGKWLKRQIGSYE